MIVIWFAFRQFIVRRIKDMIHVQVHHLVLSPHIV